MPFSVKRITHAFLQHEKNFIYNKQRDLRTLPLPFKRTYKQKIEVQVKLQENCTKPKKWKPQPFRAPSARDKEIHKRWRVLSCVLWQNSRNSNNIWTHFVSANFAHNHWLGQTIDGPHGDTTGSFSKKPSEHKARATLHSTLKNSSRLGIYSFVLFSTHSSGQSGDLL